MGDVLKTAAGGGVCRLRWDPENGLGQGKPFYQGQSDKFMNCSSRMAHEM